MSNTGIGIKKNQIIELEIFDMSADGRGIGRIEGIIVFVEGAILGEVVKVRITKVKKRFIQGIAEGVVSPSPLQHEEPCPYINMGCGGCAMGRLSYDAQLSLKAERVRKNLEKIGNFDANLLRAVEEPIIPSPNTIGYRNKAIFTVESGNTGGIGMVAHNSNSVVPCQVCSIQNQAINAVLKSVSSFIRKYPKERKHLKRIMVRTGDDSHVMLGIMGEWALMNQLQNLVNEINDNVSLTSVYGKDHRNQWELIAGKPTIKKTILGNAFEIGPDAFFQVNDNQTPILYNKVMDYVYFDEKDRLNSKISPVIADIYCGVGSIGLAMANNAKYVVGVEANREAFLNANRNASINGIVNARYFHGKAEDVFPKLAAGELEDFKMPKIDVAIVDPPRSGCEIRLIETIGEIKPEKIVYVSCDPSTMARDVAFLSMNYGYELRAYCPVDMFPNTASVETVAILSHQNQTEHVDEE